MKYTGKYNNKTCSEENAEGEGKYELESWEQLTNRTFKGKGGEAALSVYIKGFGVIGSVTCGSSKDHGEITGPSSSTLTIELLHCEVDENKCTSSGARAGTIVLGPSSDELGYIEEGPVRVGDAVDFVSNSSSCGDCGNGGVCLKVGGLVIGEVTGNVNTVSNEWTLAFAVNGSGEQSITHFQGEAEEHSLFTEVEGVGTFETGIADTIVQRGPKDAVFSTE
jgi:hypothetical protein